VPSTPPQTLHPSTSFDWPRICSAAGIAAFIFLLYCVETIAQVSLLGGPPASVGEAFQILQRNKAIGLLRLDFATVLALPLYYLIFFGLYAALKDTHRTHAAIATTLVFIGLTLVLAMPTALPMLALSDQYASATTDAAKAHFLAAGEAVLATDIWHGTGAYIGGLLLQSGAVWISVVMLRGVFSRWTAYIGIFTHGLDALHIVFAPFLPHFAGLLMIVAGLGYPVWLVLVGRRLLRLGRVKHSG
jgi:hypothetical protein